MNAEKKAIIGSTTVNDLVIDITLNEDEFMSSVSERYGLFSATYVVEYYYNHNRSMVVRIPKHHQMLDFLE